MVYPKTEEEHAEYLTELLRSLREHQLNGMINNCSFFQTELQYLGHVVSKEGIAVDPKMIRAMI